MTDDENLIERDTHDREESIDRMLRPKYLSEYVGQEPVKQQMEIFIEAAKNRQESLDHVLIFVYEPLTFIQSVYITNLTNIVFYH